MAGSSFCIENIQVWRDEGVFSAGTLYVQNGRISAPFATDQKVNGEGMFAIPGLIDLHTHGRGGSDFCSAGTSEIRAMAYDYACNGVTALLPTLASETLEEWRAALARIAAAQQAAFLGVHLEGRWLSPARRGAHAEEFLAKPDPLELRMLVSSASGMPIRRVTFAPELDEDGKFAAACRELGIKQCIGHTDADYATTVKAISRGADSFTHLYNAMPPLYHRAGGPVAAALSAPGKNTYAELICDGIHVSPEMVSFTYRLKGKKLMLVSDSTAGAGMKSGRFTVGGLPAYIKDGMAVTAEGKLAGSTLSLLEAVQNLAKFCHISPAEAIHAATIAPASYMGLMGKRGTLRTGAVADIVLLESETATVPAKVICGGEWIKH